jgi:hypothetical protein
MNIGGRSEPMRARAGYLLFLLALGLGLLAVLLASANRIAELRSRRAPVLPPPGSGQVVQLPMTLAEAEPYPYPLPPSPVELQGGSVNLIIAAALLVFIIVGGVIYSRTAGRPVHSTENSENPVFDG